MSPSHSCHVLAGDLDIRLAEAPAGFRVDLAAVEVEHGLHHVTLELTAGSPLTPPPIKLAWSLPIVEIKAVWYPGCNARRWLTRPWEISVHSAVTRHAPVVSLYDIGCENRFTFACSDALNPVESTASVHEETATFSCHLIFFDRPSAPVKTYRAILRLDRRRKPYFECLQEVRQWWATMPGMAPAPVPEAALQPVYSTWYSFHQELTDRKVEAQCRLAKELGCELVILDDGWQTSDNTRGYAFCGDWEPCPEKFPDMAAHVSRVHVLGMKSMLWFSVPFIGPNTAAYLRFQGKYLFHMDRLQASVLDPRYPDVREYLIGLYERAVRDWGFDGLKLDFVDQFSMPEESDGDTAPGRDILSGPEAADRLLHDTRVRLSRINPDVLIEFRQSYVGPRMRNYGNLFRASDCPADALCNRVRIVDVRLIAGDTAAHSDMIMWSTEEPVESAALQFLNVLFSVPQISVKLDAIPPDHLEMLRFWMGFWKRLRPVLMAGKFEPYYPELHYPFILAKTSDTWVGACYADIAAPLVGPLPAEIYLVNATSRPRLILETGGPAATYQIDSLSVLGKQTGSRKLTLEPDVHALEVPRSGLLHLKRT
ncbi:MAG TPA: glycoside hydrolase family 36 protein [Chthoniobacteraceae bacterium]|jgi:alpha-galactosidase|nr:glycoside hydrolase family 36 protein [Chthoniobacteraceae bacterium]